MSKIFYLFLEVDNCRFEQLVRHAGQSVEKEGHEYSIVIQNHFLVNGRKLQLHYAFGIDFLGLQILDSFQELSVRRSNIFWVSLSIDAVAIGNPFFRQGIENPWDF